MYGHFSCSSRLFTTKNKYSRQILLNIGRTKLYHTLDIVQTETLKELCLLRWPVTTLGLTATPPPERRHRKWWVRKQKKGKRGGIRARLATNPTHPAIPSIILANVRSLDNKMDHIRLLRSAQRDMSNCLVLLFTETWLNDKITDSAVQLEQLTCYRVDRVLVNEGKTRD